MAYRREIQYAGLKNRIRKSVWWCIKLYTILKCVYKQEYCTIVFVYNSYVL